MFQKMSNLQTGAIFIWISLIRFPSPAAALRLLPSPPRGEGQGEGRVTNLSKVNSFAIYSELFADNVCMKVIKIGSESDRTRGATLRGVCLSFLVALLISGCTAGYPPEPLPVNHPANPAAPEAPLPPPSQAFRDKSIPSSPTEETSMLAPPASHSMAHGGH